MTYWKNQTEIEKAVAGFNASHGDAAARDGWIVAVCHGSEYGPVQIQKIDDPEGFSTEIVPPSLESDDVAKLAVLRGSLPHQTAARELILRLNPQELAYAGKLGGSVRTPLLCQDCNRKLSQWFASRVDARAVVRRWFPQQRNHHAMDQEALRHQAEAGGAGLEGLADAGKAPGDPVEGA